MTLRSTLYHYFPTTLTGIYNAHATTGIARTSVEYKMLYTNSSTGADAVNAGEELNIDYWLGSSFVGTEAGRAIFGLHAINSSFGWLQRLV